MDFQSPSPNSEQKASLLLQRLFESRLNDDEARELLELWKRVPSLAEEARKNYQVETALHFAASLKNKPLSVTIDNKRYWAEKAENTSKSDGIDFDELLRLSSSGIADPPFHAVPKEQLISWPVAENVLKAFRKMGRYLPSSQRIIGLSVLFLAIVGTALFFWEFQKSPRAPRTVAHLSGFDGIVWGNCVAPILPGDPVESGWLRVVSGSVSMKLLNGTDLVLEGPAEFRIDDDGNAFLQNGYLSADVPPLAKKLRIGTPQLDVKVLGTAFWIKADENNSEVHLLRGKLELAGPKFGNLLLGAGEAFSLPNFGKTRRFSVIADDFVSSKQVAAKTEATLLDWDNAVSAPESIPGRPDGDPSLLIHFDFKRIGRSVPNLSRQGNRPSISGKVFGCSRAEGHKPSGSAVAFRKLNDRIAFELPGKPTSLTLCTWVKTAKTIDARIPILMSTGLPPGGVQWMINADGRAFLNVNSQPPILAKSPVVFNEQRRGRWVHLAVVLDGSARRVAWYVDGVEIDTASLNLPDGKTPNIEIGLAELGSWDHIRESKRFGGDLFLDDFLLFDRALKPEEIGAIAGK